MSTEANKKLVRRYFAAIDATSDPAMLDEFVAPDFVDHSPTPGFSPDLAGLKGVYALFVKATPGTHAIEDMIAEDDKVVIRVSAKGTHTDDFLGIPETGREFTMTGIVILRIRDGKIVERWNELDMVGALVQLGAVNLPAPA
jgi:predicted ester cyclase